MGWFVLTRAGRSSTKSFRNFSSSDAGMLGVIAIDCVEPTAILALGSSASSYISLSGALGRRAEVG